jgi:hypothetical protein
VVLVVRQGSQMEVGVVRKDLASCRDDWCSFMEEDQMRSSRWFRKILEIYIQKGRQEDISKMSGVARDNFRSGRKVIPQQCDKPPGLKIFLPLITDYSFIDCISRFCSGINPFKLSIEFSWGTLSVPSRREGTTFPAVRLILLVVYCAILEIHWYHWVLEVFLSYFWIHRDPW